MTDALRCPACGGENLVDRERVGRYQLKSCGICTVVFSDPMHAGDEAFYEGHLVYSNVSEDVAKAQLAGARSRANMDLLRKLSPGARVLDIGCGFGAFVAVAREVGCDSYGVDFNSAQVNAGRKAFGLDGRLLVGRVEDLPSLNLDAGYDRVTLFEVIEHVEAPRRLVELAIRLLKPGGILALSCPNESRWQPAGRIFVDYPPHHLTRWTPVSLVSMLKALGLGDVSIRIDSSLRDVIWTAVVNRAAARRSGGRQSGIPIVQESEKSTGARSWKHTLFDVAGIALAPVDQLLKIFRIGTMGMRVQARKPMANL